jgi:hypothetical protein
LLFVKAEVEDCLKSDGRGGVFIWGVVRGEGLLSREAAGLGDEQRAGCMVGPREIVTDGPSLLLVGVNPELEDVMGCGDMERA